MIASYCKFDLSFARETLVFLFVCMQESGANSHLPTVVPSTNELVTVWDPELGRTNPSEQKQLKLARSLTRGIVNKHLKPSSNELK